MNPVCKYKYDAQHNLDLRVRLTTSGKTLDYPYQSTTSIPSNMSIDTSLNAAASGDGHLFHVDIGNFFIEHDHPEPVYIIMPFDFIPQATKNHYSFQPKIKSKTNEKYAYMKQVKAVYGLKQSNSIIIIIIISEKEHEVSPGKYIDM